MIQEDCTFGSRLSNCWLPVATWIEAIKRIGHIDPSMRIDTRQFNTAMSRSSKFGAVMQNFDGSNLTGVFRITFRHQHFYFLTQPSRQVSYPSPLDNSWRERVLEVAANILVIPSTRTRPLLEDDDDVGDRIGAAASFDGEEREESLSKRPRI